MANPTGSKAEDEDLHLAVSKRTFNIAGILTTVYGLEELPSHATEVACLWLLHPRLQTHESMQSISARTVLTWNRRVKENCAGSLPKGLIAVSFDQRNHGSRQLDTTANQAWREGNPRHAQDMFSIYHGTACDTSLLITHLGSSISPSGQFNVTTNFVLGISLGGHAAWQCVMNDSRITAAVIVIGCPDYTRLITDRAAKSKLDTYVKSDPPGAHFIGSPDFPNSLIDAIRQHDPAGIISSMCPDWLETSSLSPEAEAILRPLLKRHLAGKRILNLAGGKDKLVPYACSEPFLSFLKKAVRSGSWFADHGTVVEDIVFEEAGHEMTENMAETATHFIVSSLHEPAAASPSMESKI